MLPIVIRRATQSEYDAAVGWYAVRDAGLAADFAVEVQTVFDTIAAYPQRYPVVVRDIREGPLSRFPYCVYYRVRPDRIIVVGVYHHSRDPAGWQFRS